MRGVGCAAPLVYLVTDRLATHGRPLAEVVGCALEALADSQLPASGIAVQLREKDLGGGPLLALARELRAVTAAVGVRLFINDRVDVALAAAADGVHLGGGALPTDDVHALAPHLEVALSTHSPAEVARAAADPRISFVVFGPVFDTPSKRVFGPPQGIEGLAAACSFSIPVLALGGVDADTILSCLAAGAAGVACVRAVMGKRDSRAALRAFFGAIEST